MAGESAFDIPRRAGSCEARRPDDQPGTNDVPYRWSRVPTGADCGLVGKYGTPGDNPLVAVAGCGAMSNYEFPIHE